jgi:hypothetical protein
MVKLGVMGSGRLARTVTEMALEQGHEVVTITPELNDFEEELKAFPNLTVVEGASIHDGDVSRLLDGGRESSEGSIKRTVSGSYGFSVKKMLSGMSQTSGVSTRCSHFTHESGSIARVPSGMSSVSGGMSSLPNRLSSGISSNSSVGPDDIDELDILLAMLELQNAKNNNQILSPGALAMARHYAKYGMPGSMASSKLNDDEVPTGLSDGQKKSRFFSDDEPEVAYYNVPEIEQCDVIALCMTDEHGYNTGTWSAHSLAAMLKHAQNKKIFVVTRNAPTRSGLFRQIADFIDYAEFPNPSGWGPSSTTEDQVKTERLALDQLRQLNFRNENNNSLTLIRVNAMKPEKKNDRRNSYHATMSSGHIPLLGINSGDAAKFIMDNLTSDEWTNSIVHLHRGSATGVEVM